jgi:ATP-binding cassette subfamily B protein
VALDAGLLPTTMGGYLKRHAGTYLAGAAFLAVFQLAMNRIDWLSKAAVDGLFSDAHAASFAPALRIIGLGVMAFGLRLASRRCFFNVGRDIEYELRAVLLHKVHRLGQGFFRRMSTGDVMSRATSDVNVVQSLFGLGALTIIDIVFAAASSFQVMIGISPRLTGASFLLMPIMFALTYLFGRRMFAGSRAVQQQMAKLADLAQRHFSGIRVVRSFAIEAFAESRFAQATQSYLAAVLRMARLRGSLWPLVGALSATTLVIVAWYGSWLLGQNAAHGGITDGDLFAFLLAWTRMSLPLTAVGMATNMFQRGRQCFHRVQEVLDHEVEVDVAGTDSSESPAMTGLAVRHLSYASGAREILRDLSFEIPAGRSLAIVGRTGSGKSTLAQLLVRLLPTPRGAVFIDERDICDVPRDRLRERIGYAQQDPFLFSTTVFDNVALGLDLPLGTSTGDARVSVALRDAQIAGEVARLPNGAQTQVGERGLQLSGGQRQRVALARALVSPAPLLIFDDPLSAVDARTEAAILDALRRRAELQSMVLITNRVAAAARCDQVLVLDHGRIVQTGPHAELVGTPGLYATLAEEQRVAHELEALGAPLPNPDEAESGGPVERARASDEGSERRGSESRDLGLLARLWPFFREEGAYIAFALGLLALLCGLNVLPPLAFGHMLDTAHHHRSLVRSGLLFLALISVFNIVAFAQYYVMQIVGARSMASLRMHIFRHTDRIDMRLFDRTAVGSLVTRVVNDVETIGDMFAAGVFNSFGDLASLLLMVAMMFSLDYKLALIACTAVPTTFGIVMFLRKRARRAYRDMRTMTSLLNANLNEQLTGIGVVQAFGREEAMAATFDAINQSYRDAARRFTIAELVIEAAVELVQTLCLASILLWAAHERAIGSLIAFATIVTFSQYLKQFFGPIGILTQRYTSLQSGLASVERIFQFIDTAEVESAEAVVGEVTAPQPGEEILAFDRVGFAYRADLPVLTNVSFAARAGERIAIVGPTGAGKSTIAQLLLRLYDADAGHVRVMGRDVTTWPRRGLRRVFSVVPQEIAVFSGTLLENIALGDAEPDRARAEAALVRLGVGEFFLRREGGLDARVDERGLNFSVGERQLLVFARAMYDNAPIVLLDEATASIDSATEATIQRALDGLMAGRTSLIIAHRLSTIESADRIIVLQHGRVVESGRHEELIAAAGIYAKLYALQVAKAQIPERSGG